MRDLGKLFISNGNASKKISDAHDVTELFFAIRNRCNVNHLGPHPSLSIISKRLHSHALHF